MSKDKSSRRLHRIAFRVGVAGRTQARRDGERKTPVRSAVAAREGAPSRCKTKTEKYGFGDDFIQTRRFGVLPDWQFEKKRL